MKLVRCPRGGKVAAQNLGVQASSGEIVAFSDANAVWLAGALRKLVRSFADPAVGYVSGRASYEAPDGTNREGAYWRFELWLRAQESRARLDHRRQRPDLCGSPCRLGRPRALVRPRPRPPYLMVQRGRRAVYDPDAVSVEKPSRDIEDEYRRKVRMMRGAWVHVFRGMLPAGRAHPLRRALLAPAASLREAGSSISCCWSRARSPSARAGSYQAVLAVQLVWLLLAGAGRLRLPIRRGLATTTLS